MRKNRKLIVVFIVVIIVLATVLFMINRNQIKNNGEDNTVRYAAPLTIAAAPVYVADAKGFWKEEGAEVKVTYFDSGRKALDALLSDNAEVMSVSETPPLRAYLSGSKINIVATVTEHKEAKMTVRTDRITSPEDVKGKKIGTVAGTNSDYYMYRWLEAHNINVSNVEIVPLDASALSQAFTQGAVDVMFAWEPHNYNASSSIQSLSKSWPTDLYNGRHTIVMNSAYLKNNGTKAEQVIKGLIRAEEYIKNNPEDAKRIVMERTGMSEVALNKLWDEYVYKVQLDDELENIIDSEASWIKSSEKNKISDDTTRLVDPTFMLNVDKSRVGEVFKR